MAVIQDARQRTKVYLDTYITAGNLTLDDDVTQATYAVMYAYPPYPLDYEFIEDFRTGEKLADGEDTVDLLFLVDKPISKPSYNHDGTIAIYEESVSIHVQAIDQSTVTAEKLLWKAEDDLRTILLTYPYGSFRSLTVTQDHQIRYGATLIHGFTLTLNYVRAATR